MGKESASKIKKQDNTTHIIIVLFMILVNRDNRQGNVGGLSSLSYNLIEAYWTAVLWCSWDQLRVVDCLVWHSMLLYNWLISNCNAKQYIGIAISLVWGSDGNGTEGLECGSNGHISSLVVLCLTMKSFVQVFLVLCLCTERLANTLFTTF